MMSVKEEEEKSGIERNKAKNDQQMYQCLNKESELNQSQETNCSD